MPAPPKFSVSAYRGSDPFAFVSYSHDDSKWVFAELEMLAGVGIRLFYDEGLHPGRAWHDDLAQGIENASAFLFFVTSHSVTSNNCLREVNFALDKDVPVIAVHLEDIEIPSGLSLAIGDRQAIVKSRFSENEYQARLTETLQELLGDMSPRAPAASAAPQTGKWSALRVGVAAMSIVGLVVAGWWLTRADADIDQSLSAFRLAIAEDRYDDAFSIGRGHKGRIAADPELSVMWNKATTRVAPQISQSSVDVSFRQYNNSSTPWIPLGTSPFNEPVELPVGVVELKLEKAGHRTERFAVASPGPILVDDPKAWAPLALELVEEGALGDDMVLVPATNMPIFVGGLTRSVIGSNQLALPAFTVARHEVTNAEFKEFVDRGGYDNPAYWEGLTDTRDGQTVSIDTAIETFVDETGRPGPAGWTLSSYPEGQGNMPVGGVSWFEAVAYSRYRGISLPTVHHWSRFALGPWEGFALVAPIVTRESNFGDGPMDARSEVGLGPWGTFHTAGNLKEWVWNATPTGQRLSMGSAWSDYPSNYAATDAADPMTRATNQGFRIMRSIGTTEPNLALMDPVTLAFDDPHMLREPASDETFEAMRFQFTANSRTPTVVEISVVDENDQWTTELHVLHFAGEEQFSLYLFKPKRDVERFQSVVYAPHGGAFQPNAPNELTLKHLGYAESIVRGGRVIAFPIWTNSYERFVSADPTNPDLQRRFALGVFQDSIDTINYLDTLSDIDTRKVGYFAESYGTSVFGSLLMAVQGRFDAGVFLSSGIVSSRLHPMLDGVHYAPRIKKPILMINGRFDPAFPYEQSQKRLYDLIGTQEPDKRHVVYDAGHFSYPENAVIREVSDWFDRYLGPI